MNLISEIMLFTAQLTKTHKTVCFFVIPIVWHGPYKRDHVGVTNFETSSQTGRDISLSTIPQRNPSQYKNRFIVYVLRLRFTENRYTAVKA